MSQYFFKAVSNHLLYWNIKKLNSLKDYIILDIVMLDINILLLVKKNLHPQVR